MIIDIHTQKDGDEVKLYNMVTISHKRHNIGIKLLSVGNSGSK